MFSSVPAPTESYFATAAERTCVRKNPPLVRSITCWYTLTGGWFMITVPAL